MADFSVGFTEGSFLLLNGQKHLSSVGEDLKCKWNVFFYSRIWKSSKNKEDRRLPFLNLFEAPASGRNR